MVDRSKMEQNYQEETVYMAAQRRIGLDAFQLKIIMAVLMVLDHLYYNLYPDTLLWGHIAARVVAPTFCYLMTEGMLYTRNRPRYLLRMLGFALAMLAGNCILYALYGRWIDNSILMSLTISGTLILCIEKCRQCEGWKRMPWILCIFPLIGASLLFEGAYMLPLMALIFYYLRERPVVMWAAFFLAFSAGYLYSYTQSGNLSPYFWICLSIIPILSYNGRRGYGGPIAKYFFYIFYPLHLWIIFLIEQAVLYGGL